ncbi:signal peptidase I [Bradyrhizobium japonicum]
MEGDRRPDPVDPGAVVAAVPVSLLPVSAVQHPVGFDGTDADGRRLFFAAKYAYGYGRYSFPFAPSWISGRVFAAEPEHGDVVVFRAPKDTSVDYVKRVVGLPGDRIQMRQGQLFLNDRPVTRVALANGLAGTACGLDGSVKVKRWRETLPNGNSYITYDCVENGYYDNTNVYAVPPGHFFVLGDNRDNSSDSRVMATMGFIPMDNLVGRVTRIFWSLDEDGEPHMERLGKVW